MLHLGGDYEGWERFPQPSRVDSEFIVFYFSWGKLSRKLFLCSSCYNVLLHWVNFQSHYVTIQVGLFWGDCCELQEVAVGIKVDLAEQITSRICSMRHLKLSMYEDI